MRSSEARSSMTVSIRATVQEPERSAKCEEPSESQVDTRAPRHEGQGLGEHLCCTHHDTHGRAVVEVSSHHLAEQGGELVSVGLAACHTWPRSSAWRPRCPAGSAVPTSPSPYPQLRTKNPSSHFFSPSNCFEELPPLRSSSWNLR